MIVLDEQLMGRNLERKITRWYRGSVQFITDLRPDTVIKDDAIPALLCQQRQATFITINEKDFWQRILPNRSFCVVCFAWPDTKAELISAALRRLFKHPEFATKRNRMGKVVRIGDNVRYYSRHPAEAVRLDL